MAKKVNKIKELEERAVYLKAVLSTLDRSSKMGMIFTVELIEAEEELEKLQKKKRKKRGKK